MGHRANYILIENGQHSIYFSRWGGANVPSVSLAGPKATVAYIRSLTPVETLLDDTWAEGGMLCDLDRRYFSFWGGFALVHNPYLRRYLLPAVRSLWPGWQVEWMNDDIVELANAVGVDPTTLMEPQPVRPSREPLEVHVTDKLRAARTLITLRRHPNWVRDYLLREEAISALLLGPALLDSVAGSQLASLPNESEMETYIAGLYIDVSAQIIWLSMDWHCDEQTLLEVRKRWPGWQVGVNDHGFYHHVELTGRDPALIAVPHEQAIAELVEELTANRGFDSVALYRAISEAQPSGAVPVRVGLGFCNADQPPQSADERRMLLTHLLRDIANNPNA